MPDATISPPTPGATTYTVVGSDGLIADLQLSVSADPTGFTLRLPADGTTRVTLARGATELELLPGPVSDPPPGGSPTFANRRVEAAAVPADGGRVLNCTIQALAAAADGEAWVVRVGGLGGASCAFSQRDNSPASLTVTRLFCAPGANFSVGGEAVPAGTGAAVKEKCSVRLEAAPGGATVVKAAGAADPSVRFDWSVTGAVSVPALPATGSGPKWSFFAPGVAAEQAVTMTLRVTADGGPSGALSARVDTPLTVRPLGGPVEVGDPFELGAGDWEDHHCNARPDGDGFILAWDSTRLKPQAEAKLLAARLDLHAPGAVTPTSVAVEEVYHRSSGLVTLPDGRWLVAYITVTSTGDAKLVFKAAALADLPGAPAVTVSDLTDSLDKPQVVAIGKVVVFFFHRLEGIGANLKFMRRYRRYHVTDGWIDAAPQLLDDARGSEVCAAGDVWAAYKREGPGQTSEIRAARLDAVSGSVSLEPALFTGQAHVYTLVAGAPGGDIFVFWVIFNQQGFGVKFRRRQGGSWQPEQTVPNTESKEIPVGAVFDSQGGLWLFLEHIGAPPPNHSVRVTRRAPDGSWSDPVDVVFGGSFQSAVALANDTIWVFWRSNTTFGTSIVNLFGRRVLTHL